MFDDALNTTIAGARSHTIGDLLRRSALRYPNRPALVFAGDTRNYAELDDHVNRVANPLTERGVLPRAGSCSQEPNTADSTP